MESELNTTTSVNMRSTGVSERKKETKNVDESIHKSSTFVIDCDPCGSVGEHVEAKGFCSECNEYYCQTCYRVHTRSKSTKDHPIMDISKMDVTSTPPVSVPITNVADITDIIELMEEVVEIKYKDEYHFKRDFNIKHQDEKKACFIVSMSTISDHEIVLLDHENKSVKMVNTELDVIAGFVKFESAPTDVTTIPNKEVMVTFPFTNQIRVLSTAGGLFVKRTIKVNGTCCAIEYCHGKLYVSYVPVKFQVLSLSGGVKKTIEPDTDFKKLCEVPDYMAVHPDRSKIYVSDWKTNVVVCMNINGELLNVYKDVELKEPYEITFTPFGSLYLCNRRQHIIYKMAEDLSEAVVVLGKHDGLECPNSMCFCPGKKSLYISSSSRDPSFANMVKQYVYDSTV